MDQLDNINLDSSPSPEPSFIPPTMFQITFMQMVKDMRFVGMFIIVYGAISCLSIIGAIVGIPYIFIGMRMRESADQFEIFKSTNSSQALRVGFEIQAKYYRIIKILIIIMLVLMVVGFIIFFAFLIPIITSMYDMQRYG
jgi:hypothetical protein